MILRVEDYKLIANGDVNSDVEALNQKHQSLFMGTFRLKNCEIKLEVDGNVARSTSNTPRHEASCR